MCVNGEFSPLQWFFLFIYSGCLCCYYVDQDYGFFFLKTIGLLASLLGSLIAFRCSIVDEGFCVSFLGVGLLDILAGHNTCCLGSYVSGRWTLLSR